MKTAEMIKTDVEQELRWEPSVCATKIGVSVNGGVVYEPCQQGGMAAVSGGKGGAGGGMTRV